MAKHGSSDWNSDCPGVHDTEFNQANKQYEQHPLPFGDVKGKGSLNKKKHTLNEHTQLHFITPEMKKRQTKSSDPNIRSRTLPKNVVKPIWFFGLESRDAVTDSHKKNRFRSADNIHRVSVNCSESSNKSTNRTTSTFNQTLNQTTDNAQPEKTNKNIPVTIATPEHCGTPEFERKSVPSITSDFHTTLHLNIPKINHSSSNSDKSPNSMNKSPNSTSYFSDKSPVHINKSPRVLSRTSYSSFDSGMTSRRESGKFSHQNLIKVSKLMGPEVKKCLELCSAKQGVCKVKINSRRGSLDGVIGNRNKSDLIEGNEVVTDQYSATDKYSRSFSIHKFWKSIVFFSKINPEKCRPGRAVRVLIYCGKSQLCCHKLYNVHEIFDWFWKNSLG